MECMNFICPKRAQDIRIEEVEPKVEAYVTINKEYAYNKAEELQKRLDNGEDIGVLGGVPVAIKDNM